MKARRPALAARVHRSFNPAVWPDTIAMGVVTSGSW